MSSRKRAEAPTEAVAGLWTLPEGWWWERLGSLGDWTGGGTPSKSNEEFWTNGTIPWVSPKDMKRTTIDSATDLISAAALTNSATRLVPAGSVLCVMRSGILAHTFPVAVNTVDITMNQDMRALRPRADISAVYLAHYLRSIQELILNRCRKHGTTVSSIESSRLDDVPVPICNPDMQRSVIGKLDHLFTAVEDGEAALEKAQADLEVYRRSLLKAAVTGELTADWRTANALCETGAELLSRILADRRARWKADSSNKGKSYPEPLPPDLSACSVLPADWIWASLDQLSWASSYGTSAKCSYEANGNPVLRIPNVKLGGIDINDLKYSVSPLELRPDQHLQPFDLLIVRTNGSVDLIGKTGLVTSHLEDETTYFASYLIRFRLAQVAHLMHWLPLVCEGPYFRASVLESIGTSAGQYNLSLSKLERFPIPIPPGPELLRISNKVGEALAAVQEAEHRLTVLSAENAGLRQSILAAAFRRELS